MKPKFKEIVLQGTYIKSRSKLSMYYVYTPNQGNFLIKSHESNVAYEYIKEHFPICLYRATYWKKGKSRGYWCMDHPFIHVTIRDRQREISDYKYERSNKIFLQFRDKEFNKKVVLSFRRLPNKWIPEYDKAIREILEE